MAEADILLATFNGAAMLPELLASLEKQSFVDWRLLHRDDGSVDGSSEVVAEWASRRSQPYMALHDDRGHLGACANYAALLEKSDAPYFLPCDQDDIWKPNKVELLINRAKACEAKIGLEVPVIAHSDLVVIDEKLGEIDPSFWRFQRLVLPREHQPWIMLTLQNSITGCAMIGNAALRRLALPIPEQAMMHDWWLALVAACFGRIESVGQPTVYYRQHQGNTLGAKNWQGGAGARRILLAPVANFRRAQSVVFRTRLQAAVFLERYAGRLSTVQSNFLSEYIALAKEGFFQRKTFPIRHGLWFDDVVRNLGLLLVI